MTNMKVLKRTRQKRGAGDVFVLQIIKGKYHWGRVISLNAKIGGFEDCLLIYIYKTSTDSYDEVPDLKKSDLLVPPFGINDQPWTRGYFLTIDNQPLRKKDLLLVHCFEDVCFGRYVDEHGNILDSKTEPCGEYGLASFRSLDNELSEVLGIDLMPD